MVKYDYKPFIINCKELVKMLTSIVKTTQIKLTAENQKLKTKH